MQKPVFYTLGTSPALIQARLQLKNWGYPPAEGPCSQITHLLTPVPTKLDAKEIVQALEILPAGITVMGGNLPPLPCQTADFLQDPYYLAENASITAACALELAQQRRPLKDTPVLVIGWGRIGKCLVCQLRRAGAKVCLTVRKDADCAILQTLGHNVKLLSRLDPSAYPIIFNTAPAPVLEQEATDANAVLIDLASRQGIAGDRVLWARGLPGKMAPQESGALIAKTALRYALGKENL